MLSVKNVTLRGILEKRTETEVRSIKCTCVSRLPRLGSISSSSGRSAEKQFPQYSLQDVPADRAWSASSFIVPRFRLFFFPCCRLSDTPFEKNISARKFVSSGPRVPRPRSIRLRRNLTTNIYFYQSIVCLWRDTLNTI